MEPSAPSGGKVHPVAPEAQFPRYDFFRKHDPQLEQRQQLAVGLEACRRGWASRLGAMLYRTELSLSCRLQHGQPEVESLLCFGMEHEQQGQMRPSAWLLIEQSTLYQLAEMSFGGTPVQGREDKARPISETERRLGSSLLTLFATDLVAQLLLNAGPGRVGMAASVPDLSAVTLVSIDIDCAGQRLSWQLALPVLLNPEPVKQEQAALGVQLSGVLNERLPQLTTRLRVSLAEFELPLGQLPLLQEGDILPIHLLQETRARVGEQPVLKGRVAEQQGMLVFASHGFID